MFCKKCGTKNGEDVKFCISCGNQLFSTTPLSAVSASKSQTSPKPSIKPPFQNSDGQTGNSSSPNNAAENDRLRSKPILIGIIGLLVILVIGSGIYFLNKSKETTPETVDPILSNTESIALESNPEMINSEENLFVVDPDNSSKPDIQTAPEKGAEQIAKPKKTTPTKPLVNKQENIQLHEPLVNEVPKPEPVTTTKHEARFQGLFGLVDEKRLYPTAEMKNQAIRLWEKERKILEPDGSINERYAQKPSSGSGGAIPGH